MNTGRPVDGIGAPIGAVVFKSMYKNKQENVWVPGSVEEIMACPGFRGLKQHRRIHSSRWVSLWVYHIGKEILYR